MRISRRQLGHLTRAATVVSACLMFWAITSGLLLAVHLHTTEHGSEHDSHHCTICQQLLVMSKKPALAPSVELVHDLPSLRADTPECVEHIEDRHPETVQPRSPPC
jgi:hypothetical protein